MHRAIFIAVGIAIAGGLLSYAPWLAFLFFAFSAPVFYRYYLLRTRDPCPSTRGTVAARAAQLAGSIGLALSIVAASAGTFFGTCTIASYVVGLPLIVRAGARRQSGQAEQNFAMHFGVVFGICAALVTLVWLARVFRRASRRPTFGPPSSS